jgi:hypothetical protein
MKRVRRHWVGAIAGLATTIAVAVLVAAGSASAVTVLAGNLLIKINGATSPKALPKNKMAPIGFHGSASVETNDASHIPPALSTQLLVDKHIAIDTTGLPTCTVGKITSASPAAAMKACGDALIGKGTSEAEVQFPEQKAFTAKGPLLAFNGPSSGGYGADAYHEQLYYVYAAVPVPTALIAVAKVSKGTGKYGYKISVSIPKIAGGAGSFSGAEFTIDRKWSYRGQKHSFLSAECANGHFGARVEVNFGDGTNVIGDVLQACRATG